MYKFYHTRNPLSRGRVADVIQIHFVVFAGYGIIVFGECYDPEHVERINKLTR